MKTIWKYTLDVGTNKVDIPAGGRVLSVGYSEGDVAIWAMVDPDAYMERRQFVVVGTGWSLDSQLLTGSTYLGTVNIRGFVWHVFEIFLRSDLHGAEDL